VVGTVASQVNSSSEFYLSSNYGDQCARSTYRSDYCSCGDELVKGSVAQAPAHSKLEKYVMPPRSASERKSKNQRMRADEQVTKAELNV
jgi:hypothetical protein